MTFALQALCESAQINYSCHAVRRVHATTNYSILFCRDKDGEDIIIGALFCVKRPFRNRGEKEKIGNITVSDMKEKLAKNKFMAYIYPHLRRNIHIAIE